MKTLVVGDIHGEWGPLNTLINKKKPNNIIQLGDFGWWPHFHNKTGLTRRGTKFNQFGIKNKNTSIYWIAGNHECVSKDTDVLTETGWMRISDIIDNNIQVRIAQFDIDSKKISFDYPIKKIKKISKELIEIKGEKIHQKVTPKHDVIVNNKKYKAENLLNSTTTDKNFILHGNIDNYNIDIDDNYIKLLTWVITDGTMIDYSKYNESSIKRIIQFKLSKERKINALTTLLDDMGIKYTFKPAIKSKANILQPYHIKIYSDEARKIFSMLCNKKQIPLNWKYFNKEQLEIFLETLSITDGTLINRKTSKYIKWNTTNKSDVDIIQELCVCNGYNFIFTAGENSDKSFSPNTKQFRCSICINTEFISPKKTQFNKIQYNDYVYCFTMPKGTLITRFNGRVNFTGNCWDDLYCLTDYNTVEIQDGITYCPFGTILELEGHKILCCGGAESIDRHLRTEGLDWWRRELICQQDMDNLPDANVDIVVSHTAPRSFLREVRWYDEKFNDPSTFALDMILEEYKPSKWYSGHFHKYMHENINGCEWNSLSMAGIHDKWWSKLKEI